MTADLAHQANTLEPQDLFTGAPVKLADINPIYPRLGKKTKRTYAWLHNALCAAVRQFAGRSPADVEKALVQQGVDEVVARQAALQWKESLAIRDALEPLARGQNPTVDVLNAFEQEAIGLFIEKENDAVRKELQRLVSLIGAALACKTTRSLMDCLASNARPDATGLPHRAVFFGIRSSCFVIGGGPGAKDDTPQDCECDDDEAASRKRSYEDMQRVLLSEGVAVAHGVLAKLSATNQYYFREAMLAMMFMMNELAASAAAAEDSRRIIRPFLELPAIQAFSNPDLVASLVSLSGYLSFKHMTACIEKTLTATVTNWQFPLPNPKTEEAQQKCFAQMAGLFERAAATASPEAEALYRRLMLSVNCQLGVFDEMTHSELEKARSQLPENYRQHWDQYRAFLEVLSCYRQGTLPERVEELLPHFRKLFGKLIEQC